MLPASLLRLASVVAIAGAAVFAMFAVFAVFAAAAASAAAAHWPDGKELTGRLIGLARHERATLHEIGRSAGDQKLRLLEIAPVTVRDGGQPAILVLANSEGDLPLASLGAVELAAAILAAAPDEPAAAVRWYVLPIASPDGLDRVFAVPRAPGGYNATPVDLDGDGFEGEDPHDDLDGDGLITWMLIEDPAGQWALSADGLPVQADPARGVPGRFRRESEGLDRDGDGRYNEDPPGGVDVSRNFPHAFEYWTGRAGRWPVDQPETRAIVEFALARRDIALVVVLGRASNLYHVPPAANERNDRNGVAAGATAGLEVPRRPPAEDLPWWRALSERYHDFLAVQGRDGPRLVPPLPGPGAPAAWAYYQYGTPTVALDLWTLPMPADSVAVNDTLTTPAPRGPQPDPALVELKRRTEQLGLPGWRPWTEVTLPDGVRALVGGPEPGALDTPPAAEAEIHARALLPFLLELPDWLPGLTLSGPEVRELGSGVYEVTVHVGNPGRLPYPTAMGAINRRPPPVVVTLAGAEALQDNLRQVVRQIPAGGAVAVRWVVRTGRPERVTVTAAAPSLGSITVSGGSR
jgi:hypothetical protein